jgi:hypothetical protein
MSQRCNASQHVCQLNSSIIVELSLIVSTAQLVNILTTFLLMYLDAYFHRKHVQILTTMAVYVLLHRLALIALG